jgi:3-deoxy-7-phosphoheptulonate synthase
VIVVLHEGVDAGVVDALGRRLDEAGLRVVRSSDEAGVRLAVFGSVDSALAAELEGHAAICEIVKPRLPTRLVHRAFRKQPSQVLIGDVPVGRGSLAVIAGPCSVDGERSVREIARAVRRAGAHILRGGAFKPRTSPYSFQGFGVEGLRQLKDAGDAEGLPVISEIMDASDLSAFVDHDIDCLQIGARNMQNFTLLHAVASAGKPVLLKRGLAATVDEWLCAAEHLAAAGCERIILCERGIRTFETATRNTLDLTVLPLLREQTHLPVLVDPAHAAGIARIIPPLSRAAVAVGADGLAVEVHTRPEHARSDAEQALLPGQLAGIVADARVLAAVDGRRLAAPRRPVETPVRT